MRSYRYFKACFPKEGPFWEYYRCQSDVIWRPTFGSPCVRTYQPDIESLEYWVFSTNEWKPGSAYWGIQEVNKLEVLVICGPEAVGEFTEEVNEQVR